MKKNKWGIRYSLKGLEKLKEVYEDNWKKMMKRTGSRRYQKVEHQLNSLDKKIRYHLGICMEVPQDRDLGSLDYMTFLDVLVRKPLTKGAVYDIVDNIDGEE